MPLARVTTGAAVSVTVPAVVFVTVTIPLCGVIVPVTSDGAGPAKVTVIGPVPVPLRFTGVGVTVAPV